MTTSHWPRAMPCNIGMFASTCSMPLTKSSDQLSPLTNTLNKNPYQKKLAKGDGQWLTQHTILGWDIDTVAMTLALPSHCTKCLNTLLTSIPCSCKHISTTGWHQIVGELCSMVLAIQDSHSLFSTLQSALWDHDGKHHIWLGPATHNFLDDFQWLATELTQQPT